MKELVYKNFRLMICRIPLAGEGPSDEFIEWLHEIPGEWSGDDNGVVISRGSEHSQIDRMGPAGGLVFRQRHRLGPNVFTDWEYDVCETHSDLINLLNMVCVEITSNTPLAKSADPA